jgi:phage portal protein BeeE
MASLLAKAASRLSASLANAAGDGKPPVSYVSDRGGLFYGQNDSVKAVAERAYDSYGSVGTLFAIVSQIGNAFASTEWHLYRKTSVRDKKRRTEVLTHPFLTVWDKPNDFYTGRMFRETVQQHLDLVGEGIFVLDTVGPLIIGMWPVRPDRMQPVKSSETYMSGWIYIGPEGEEIPLDLDQVIQIKTPNPADPFRGMGAVQTVLKPEFLHQRREARRCD